MSSKQARAQLELNDLEPQQDPKGGDHPPVTINLNFSDAGLGGISLGPIVDPDNRKLSRRDPK